MRKLIAALFLSCACAALALPQATISGPITISGPFVISTSSGSGGGGGTARSVILDGVDDYFAGSTGTALPASQSAWRVMFKLRGLSPPPGMPDAWLFHEFSGERLQLKYVEGGSYGILQVIAMGPGFTAGTGYLVVPGPDVTVLVRYNGPGNESSLEIWKSDGTGRVGTQTPGTGGGATNWQGVDFAIGRHALSAANYFPGKIDKAVGLTGAGTYFSTMPDVEATTGNLFQYDFNDNGNDASGNAVHLTPGGAPAYENTP